MFLASCFGDRVTEPGRPRYGRFAVVPQFDMQALRVVDFTSVRIVLRRADNSIALDTVVLFPPESLSITLSLPVLITSAEENLGLTMAMMDAAGDTVFRAGPIEVTAVSGSLPVRPVEPEVTYVGVGSNAVGVRFVAPPGALYFQDSADVVAEAYDASDQPIANTPIIFESLDTARLAVPAPGTGRVVARTQRGPARLRARLLTHDTTETTIAVQPRPTTVVVNSGNTQTGTVGEPLALQLVAQVNAADNLGVQGVMVRFAVTSGGGSLSVDSMVTDSLGRARTTWTLGTTPGGQSVTATGDGLSGGGASVAFTATATAGTPARLRYVQQPTTVDAGQPITPDVLVEVTDTFDNRVTSFTGNVSVALASNPGSATLGGTTTQAAVAGLATFDSLTVSTSSSGYTLSATAGALPPAVSAPFDVNATTPARLAFQVEPPASTTAGAALSPAIEVRILDAQGNLLSSSSDSVTIGLLANAGGATLSGTTTVAAAAGIASFADLSLDKAGAGYTLLASRVGLVGDTTTAFAITAGPAHTLAFTTQPPASTSAGTPFTVRVIARDSFANHAPFSGSVTLALAANPGGGTLGGTLTVAASGDTARFTTPFVDKAGAGYALAATATGLAADTTGAFTVTPAQATQLAFTTQPPATDTAGSPFTVVVAARDSFGNLDSAFASNVALALANNPGGTLGGTLTVAAVGGVATFTTPVLDKALAGYTLVASAAPLVPDTSTAIAIVAGAAAQLAVTAEPPATVTAGDTFGLTVAVRDAFGNAVASFADSLFVTPLTGPDTLYGTTRIVAAGGTGVFTNLRLRRPAAGLQLLVDAVSLGSDTSTALAVVPAAPAMLMFTVQPPASQQSSTAFSVTVAAHDSLHNVVPTFTDSVTVALKDNPVGATLGGLLRVAASGGLATFSTLTVDNIGSGFTLSAAAAALDSAVSNTFAINAPTGAVYWVNTSGGAWNVASNWNTGSVPVASDTVYIVQNGTYTVSVVGAVTQAKLVVGGTSGTQTLAIPGGTTLQVDSAPVTFGPAAQLHLAGTLRGVAPVSVQGAMDWQGGSLLDSGSLRIETGATLQLSSAGSMSINGRRLEVAGTMTWPGAGALSFAASGRLDILAGGLFEVTAPRTLSYASGTTAVVNAGTVRFNAAGTLTNSNPFTQLAGGTLDIEAGTWTQNAAATLAGAVSIAAGAELASSAGLTLPDGFEPAGPGLLRITGGTVAAAPVAGDSITIPNLLMQAGTLTGAGVVAVTDSLDWSGGTMTGGGATIVGTGAVLVHSGASSRTLGDRTLRNAGTIRHEGSGNLSFSGATLALLDNTASGVIEHAGAGGYSYASGIARIENAGVLRTLTGTTANVGLRTSGTLEAVAGSWTLNGNPNLIDGTVSLPAGSELILGGTLDTLAPTLAVTGAGLVRLTSGTKVVAALGTDSLVLARLAISAGTLTGAGTLAVTDSLDWSGGTMTGGGTTRIDTGAVLRHSGASGRTLGNRTLRNAGAIRHEGSGNLSFSGSVLALVDNTATGVIEHTSTGGYSYASGVARVENAGVLRTLTGTTSNVSVRTTGLLEATAGNWTLNGNPNLIDGTVTLAAASELVLSGSADTLPATLAVAGAGLVRITSGTKVVAPAAADTVALTRLVLAGGTVQGLGTLAITDSLEWTGGSMTGGGTTHIDTGAVLRHAGTSGRTLGSRTLRNAGAIRHEGSGNLSFSGTLALVDNTATGVIEHTSTGGYSYASGIARVANGGILRTLTGTFSSVAVTNSGTLEALGGAWTLSGNPNVWSGTVSLAAGTELVLSGSLDTLLPALNVTGLGLVRFSSGTKVVAANPIDTVRLPRVVFSSGVVNGAGLMVVSDSMEWSGGSMAGGGTTLIDTAAALWHTGTSGRSLGTRTLRNRGTIRHAGPGNLSFTGTPALIVNEAGAVIQHDSTGGYTLSSGSAAIQNAGTLRNLGTSFSNVSVVSTGAIEVQAGTFTLGGTPNTINGAVVLASPAAALVLGGSATDTLFRTTAVSGPGFLRLTGGTLVTDTVTGDTVRVPRFAQTGGQVTGGSVFLVTDSLVWSGGNHSGSAATSVLGDTAVAVLDGATNMSLTSTRTFINRGTMHGVGTGQLTTPSTTPGHFVNRGWFTLTNGFDINGAVTFGTITNDTTGVIERVAGGAGASIIYGNPFTNHGELRVTADTIQLGSAYNGGLAARITGSGVLGLGVSPAAIASRIEPGASAGTLTFAGAVTRSGAQAVTRIELGGTDTTQYDRVRVTGTLGLAGTLEVSLINGFTPAAGDSFVVMTYGSRTGWFDSIAGLDLGGGLLLKVDTSDATRLVLRLPAGPMRVAITAGDGIGSDTAGTALPALTVAILDDLGDVVTADDTSTVLVSILSGTGDSTAVLSGTLNAVVTNGVASFSDLSIQRAATGYRLLVHAGALLPDTSAPFTITPQAPVGLMYLVQTSDFTAGDTMAPVQVAIVDTFANRVTTSSDTVFAYVVAYGQLVLCDGVCIIPPDDTAQAVNGVATLTRLTRTQARRYIVNAVSPAIPDTTYYATSDTFTVSPAAPVTIVAATGDGASGPVSDTLADTLSAYVQDAYGNNVPAVPVAWTVLDGGGQVVPLAANSDSTGFARAQWILGAVLDTQRVVVSINAGTAADTVRAIGVIPGATRQWMGTSSTDWYDGANWTGGFTPTDTDVVAILTGTIYQPVLTSDGTVKSLVMQPGTSLQVADLVTLWIAQNADASYGSISGAGTVKLWGTGTVQGRFQNLTIAGYLTASDSVIVTGNLEVANDTSASFNLGGKRVTVGGTFRTAGGGYLVMQSPADLLEVADSATFGGGHANAAGKLTDGAITVGGHFLVNGSANAYAPDSGHVLTIGVDAVMRNVTLSQAAASRLGSVQVVGSGGVTFDSGATVMGSLTTTGSASLFANDTLEVRGPLLANLAGNVLVAPLLVIHDTMAVTTFDVGRTIFAGIGQPMTAHAYDTVQVRGDVIVRDTVTAGLVQVLPTATSFLHVGGGRLTVTGSLVVGDSFPSAEQGGRLAMTSDSDTVVVQGNAYFGGYDADSLWAGTLILNGNLRQYTNGYAGSFRAFGTHTTVFTTAPARVWFASPGVSHFNHVRVDAASGMNSVLLYTDAVAGDDVFVGGDGGISQCETACVVTLTVGGVFAANGGFNLNGVVIRDSLAGPASYWNGVVTTRFVGPGVVPDFAYSNLTIDGTRSTSTSLNVNGVLTVLDTAELAIGGNVVNALSAVNARGAGITGLFGIVNMIGSSNFVSGVVPNLTVTGGAVVGGDLDTLRVMGNLNVSGGQLVLDSTNGRTVVRVAGNATMADTFRITEASDTLEVNGRFTFTGTTDGTALSKGALLVRGTLDWACCSSLGAPSEFTVILAGNDPDSVIAVEGGFRHLVVAEGRTLLFDMGFNVSGDLTVLDSATFVMPGMSLSVGGALAVLDSGLIEMGNSFSGLNVSGNATFAGRSTLGKLSAGSLRVTGNFTQAGHAQSFTADTALTTYLTDTTGVTQVQFAAPDRSNSGSHFGHLVIENDSVALLSDLPVAGRLVAQSGAFPAGRRLMGNWTALAGDLEVADMTFDGVRLDVVDENADGLFQLDNSTFVNQDPAKDQITFTSGLAINYNFTSLTFATPPQAGVGHYLRAVNTNPTLGWTLLMNSPTPFNISGPEVTAQSTGGPLPTITWPFQLF